MSSFRSALVWIYALGFVVTLAETQLSEVIYRNHLKHHETQSPPICDVKKPSCVITIPEDEADGLTKLLNEFINVFASNSEPASLDSPWTTNTSFELNCTTGISELETSVWLILNRVWLATSCQYSDEEYDQAIREVEDVADNVLITLENVDVRLRDDTIKKCYYKSTVTKFRIILEQTIAKMREAQRMGRCYSSGVKHLTENFEEALGEIKSQKNDTAALHEETREALEATKGLKEEIDKTLKVLMTRGGALEAYKNATQTVIDGQSKKIAELTTGKTLLEETLVTRAKELEAYKNATQMDIAVQSKKIADLEQYKRDTSQLIYKQAEQIRDQAGLLEKLNAKIFPRSALHAYQILGLAGLSGRAVNLENVDYKGEFLYLARNPTDRYANVFDDGAILAVSTGRLGESAWRWEFVPAPGGGSSSFYLRNKLVEDKSIPSKEVAHGKSNYIFLEIVSPSGGAHPNQLVIYLKNIWDGYYHAVSTSNTDSALNGRRIQWKSSRSTAGSEWIVHFVS